MSTATVPAPTFADTCMDAVVQYFCCDDNVALCGLDLTEFETGPADDTDTVCPMCAHVYDHGLPCPVPGCTGDRP